jgi:hypothetical protein
MKKATIPYVLAATLLVLNLADVVSTWISVSSGKGVEGNFLVLMLGGPFSAPALFLKLIVVPAAIVLAAWGVSRRFKDTRLGVAVILPAVAVYVVAVANNVIVAAKKVKKIARERQPHGSDS